MAKNNTNVKDLKNISSFGYSKLTLWGMIGAGVLLAWAIVSMILDATLFSGSSTFSNTVRLIVLGLPGLLLGILYAVLGVFGIVKVVKSQEGKYWGVFLLGSIFAVLSPLAWFGVGGLVLALLAGLSFLVYFLLEKK